MLDVTSICLILSTQKERAEGEHTHFGDAVFSGQRTKRRQKS